MVETTDLIDRRTTAMDVVFERLHDEIVSLELLPGTKLSEVDVARRFGVSRQPVRDAFNRLDHLDLLLIRPQKATEVRGFSMERITRARFVRLAIDLEVIRQACAVWDSRRADALERNLDGQRQALDSGRPGDFLALDYAFHKLICELGDSPFAIETIKQCKQKVDRLCRLSLGREREAANLLEDHCELARALSNKDAEHATAITRKHLGRLDAVVAAIRGEHAEYFE